jgi:ParB family transcriptional regulator, chromosome partitioning protein
MTMPAERVLEKPAEKAGEKMAEKMAEKPAEKPAEKRRALGRGLESLLPAGPRVVAPATKSELSGENAGVREEDAAGTPVPGSLAELQAVAAGPRAGERQAMLEIPLEQIDHNPHQTRMEFDPESMQELALSIKVQGVIQPVVVRPGKEGRYFLILGERRLRASKMAGKATIPAVVKRVSEQQAAEMTIIENLQREDLHCLEQAAAFSNLSTDFQMTQEEIGKRVGLSRETVSNYMRLLRLPFPVLEYLKRGDLTYSHARELLRLNDEKQILPVALKAVKEKLSVFGMEDLVSDVNGGREGPEPERTGGARWVDPNVRAAQRQLETVLGMRVRIRDRKGKGKITIEYATLEDFDRVVRMLKGR